MLNVAVLVLDRAEIVVGQDSDVPIHLDLLIGHLSQNRRGVSGGKDLLDLNGQRLAVDADRGVGIELGVLFGDPLVGLFCGDRKTCEDLRAKRVESFVAFLPP